MVLGRHLTITFPDQERPKYFTRLCILSQSWVLLGSQEGQQVTLALHPLITHTG